MNEATLIDLEPVTRLSRDMAKASGGMSLDEGAVGA